MADTKISALSAAGTFTGDELVALGQGGSSVKSTLTTLSGYKAIQSGVSLTGSTIDLTSIPQTYSDLLLVIQGASHNSGSSISFNLAISKNNGSTWSTSVALSAVQAASALLYGAVHLGGYRLGAGAGAVALMPAAADLTLSSPTVLGFRWKFTGGINALRVMLSAAGSFDAGTISLYGK